MVLPWFDSHAAHVFYATIVPTNGLLAWRTIVTGRAGDVRLFKPVDSISKEGTATPAGICSTLSAAGIRLANKQAPTRG